MNLSGAFESQFNVHKELFALHCYEFIILSQQLYIRRSIPKSIF